MSEPYTEEEIVDALAAARREALEQAAKKCLDLASGRSLADHSVLSEAHDAIRALIDPPPTGGKDGP